MLWPAADVPPVAARRRRRCRSISTREGWSRFDESMVMRLPLDEATLDAAIDQIPLKDVRRFVAAALAVRGADPVAAAGPVGRHRAIQPEAGLFVLESGERAGGEPDLRARRRSRRPVRDRHRRRRARASGHARRLVLSALKWARQRGARQAWLQVEADNCAGAGALPLARLRPKSTATTTGSRRSG